MTAYAAVFDSPASVYDPQFNPARHLESVGRSAFARALNAGAGAKAKVLFNHGKTIDGTPSERFSMPMATPLEVRADGRGLLTVSLRRHRPRRRGPRADPQRVGHGAVVPWAGLQLRRARRDRGADRVRSPRVRALPVPRLRRRRDREHPFRHRPDGRGGGAHPSSGPSWPACSPAAPTLRSRDPTPHPPTPALRTSLPTRTRRTPPPAPGRPRPAGARQQAAPARHLTQEVTVHKHSRSCSSSSGASSPGSSPSMCSTRTPRRPEIERSQTPTELRDERRALSASTTSSTPPAPRTAPS